MISARFPGGGAAAGGHRRERPLRPTASRSAVEGFLDERGYDVGRLVRDLNLVTSGAIVYAAGSIAEGYSTTLSDIDLFHVGDENEGRAGTTWSYVGKNIRPFRVDLTRTTVSGIVAVVDTIRTAAVAAETDPDRITKLTHGEYQLIHRLATSVPLIHEEGWQGLHELSETVPLAGAMAAHSALYSIAWHEDLVGFLRDGDEESAAFPLSQLAGKVVDVLLQTLGDTNPSEKLRVRRLRTAQPVLRTCELPGGLLGSDIAEWYLSTVVGEAPAGSVHARARRAARLASSVLPWSMDALSR